MRVSSQLLHKTISDFWHLNSDFRTLTVPPNNLSDNILHDLSLFLSAYCQVYIEIKGFKMMSVQTPLKRDETATYQP